MPRDVRAALAEFVGTFVFLFVGIATVVATTAGGATGGELTIALAFGLALAVTITIFGAISGAHFNPAVTIGAWVGGKIDPPRAITYIAAQIAGAVAAAGLVRVAWPGDGWRASGVARTAVADGVTTWEGVLFEAVLTFVLVLVIWGAAIDGRAGRGAGAAIGGALAALHLVGIPLTGAAMNPVRALGPEVVTGEFSQWWVYWVGPVAGAVVASLIYRLFFLGEEEAVIEAPTTPVLDPGPEPVTREDTVERPRRAASPRKTTKSTKSAKTTRSRRTR